MIIKALKSTYGRLRNRFVREEDGAVTVDWVVLTAAVVGLSLVVVEMIAPALFENAGAAISSHIDEAAAK